MNKILPACAFVLSLVFLSSCATAQEEVQSPNGSQVLSAIEPKPFEYPVPIEVFDLPTAPNGVDYRIIVRAPLAAPAEGEKSSTVYFLDALLNMTPAGIMAYNYETLNYVPSSYFVGIGYREGEDHKYQEQDRTRDYTPTSFTPPEGHFLENSPQDWEGSGGAPAFFDYVENTLIPFVETRFGVDSVERTIVGKSTSGLGATYALLERPGLFNRHIIISPAIWWDDYMLPREERWVMRAARKNEAVDYPRETRAYFAVGAAEERLGLVTDLEVLRNALRERSGENLTVYLDVLEGEQHEGVFPAGFMRGFVGVYSDRRENASPATWGEQ